MPPQIEGTVKRTIEAGALLALLLTALVLEGIPPLHAHASYEPAIYNQECVLAGLAANTAGATLPPPVSATSPLTVSHTPALLVVPVPSSPLPSPADARAPPTTR